MHHLLYAKAYDLDHKPLVYAILIRRVQVAWMCVYGIYGLSMGGIIFAPRQ